MKKKTTIFKMKFMQVMSCFLLTLLCSSTFYGQTKVLANAVTYTSGNDKMTSLLGCGALGLGACFDPTVQNSGNAILANNDYARLLASPGLLAGLGSYQGVIELRFPSTLPANQWSYVRIQGDGDLFKALLGGSLGNALGGVLGTVLTGNQEMVFDARMGASSVLSRTSTQGFGTDNVKLLVDAQGNYHIAMRPSGAYDRIRITNRTGSLLGLGSEKTLDVYNAFYYQDNNQDCGRPSFTSFDGSTGLSLSVLPIEDGSLKNAIDGDLNTFSTLKSSAVLGLNVAGSISQNFYFPTTSNPTSTINIKMALGSGSLLDLKVLSGVDIIFKDNGQEVASRSVTSGLLAGTNLLGLLRNGQPVTLSFGVGVEFDQVEIRSSALVGLSLAAADVKIYDVQRYDGITCINPNITVPTATTPMLSNKNCAATVVGFGHANFPTNAVDGNNDTFTILEASSGIAVGIGAYDGFIELGFAQAAPAGETTYVRIDFDNEVLGGLLNGSVGGLLNGVVSNVLFGNHYFTIEGKSNTTTVFSRSSNDGFTAGTGTGKAKIVEDKNGHYYIAITPDASINRIRITEKLSSLVGLATVKTMNVYHACYSTGSDACEQSFATYSTSEGITLDLLGLGAAGVIDAQYAIDGDSNTASKVSVGAVGIAGSMFQQVQFHGLSSDRDHFRVKMKMQSSGTVTADVIGSIIVKAYKGDVEVYSQRLNEKLIPGLDLLGLLSSGSMINLPFAPGVEFDRVAVGISSLVAANVLANPLEIYSIERFGATTCIDPELLWDPKTTSPFNTPACGVSLGSFENVNFPYEAVIDNPANDTYATLTAGAGVAAGLGAYSGHIELKYGSPVPAHEISYIRVDSDSDLFDALLGGSLGNALGNLLGSVALGNQYIVVQALDAAGIPVGGVYNSQTGFNTEFAKLVKDKNGRFYLAVTSPVPYQGVRVEYHHTALVGARGSSSINVYSMCRETSFDACEQATFTSWDGNGIALDVLNLTNGGVANSEFVIDADNSNYSTLNLGIVGVAASVSQKIYFKTKSNIADELRVRLQLANPGLLNVDLFGNSKLIFYNGEQNVKEMTLASGLINNLDLLGLFNSGGIQSFTFAPGVVYDRVELKISSLVAVGTSAPIRLYGMSRLSAACPDPDFLNPNDVFKSPVCAGGVEIGNVRAVDDVDFAIDGDYNSYATMRADSGIIFGIGNEESILELKYDTPIAANTTSYLRISDDAGILQSLLSGSIGEVVYGLVNQVALGNNYFVVRAKNGSNQVLIGSSKDNFAAANGLIKIVQDKAGRYFVAISPNVAYTSVEIKAFSEAIVGITSQGYNLHVYGMCHETDFSGCAEGFSTSWDGSGLSVGITGVGSYGVTDAFKALNNNNNGDFSTLSLGTLNVAGHIQQNIQFNKTIVANSTFKLKMEFGAGSLNAGVFANMSVVGYKAGVQVYNQPIQNAVLGNVNLLNLFNNGGAHDVSFAMDQDVDEVALRINSLAGVSVGPDVKLYYIVEDCTDPVFVQWKSADKTSVQGGEEIEYTIHVRNTGTVNVVGAEIEDMLPANTTYVSGGTFAAGKITFPALNVAVGQTETVTFKVKVNSNLTGVIEIVNVATVNGIQTFSALQNNVNEPDTNAAPGTKIPVNQIKSVVSWKAYDVNGSKATTAVSGGENVAYYIYVRNTGNQNLTNVTVSDVLPAGLTWISGGVHAGGTVTFTIPSLAVGATSSALSFVATVAKDLTGITEIKNIALVKTDITDPGTESFPPVDNTTTPTEPDTTKIPGTVLNVTPVHNVEISKVGVSNNATSNAQAQVGDQITYTITVKNIGNKDLTNLTVNDAIPANLTITNNGGGLVTGNTIAFAIPTLAVDDEVTFTIVATVDDVVGITQIENSATVTYRNEANSGDKIETATHIMLTSCTPIQANEIILTPASLIVCAGVSFNITASTSVVGLQNPVYKWYTNASLTGTPFVGGVLTTSVNTTTTFYVTLEADGYCFSIPAATVTITVLPEAGIPTISATGGVTSVCQGETIPLTATATGVASYQWYKNGALIIGATSATYNATESGDYTAAALNVTECYSTQSASITITIYDLPAKPTITPNGSVAICEGEFVKLTSSVGVLYEWYHNGNPIEFPSDTDPSIMVTVTNRQTIDVNVAGSYTVKVFNNEGCSSVLSDATIVTVNPTPVLTVTGNQLIYVAKNAPINWPVITSSIGTVTWYFNGVVVPTLPVSIATAGVYTYTAVGVSGNCYSTETVIVNVYDNEGCPPETIRMYANSETWGSVITGGVSNRTNAVDGNPKSYSTITTGLGLLGVGTTWQTLYFPEKVAAGTPVTIKLGKEYSGLVLAGGISVVGVYKNGQGTTLDIGTLKPVQGGLLDLLAADNVIEFTFVPSDATGTKAYDGVRISVGAVLSVAQNAKVYGAYITKPGSLDCNPIDSSTNANIIDVLHGVEDLGIGVASATASVTDAWNAVDNDLNSYALISRGVAVLNQATLTTVFKQQATKGDQLRIVTEVPGNPVLSLQLIQGYTIQRYMGNQPVGPALNSNSNILDLKLLGLLGGASSKVAIIVAPFDEPYDRVKISYGNVVGVLGDFTKVYDVSIAPSFDYGAVDGDLTLCTVDSLIFKNIDDCTIYEVYTSETGTEKLTTTDGYSFKLPKDLSAGVYTFYVQAVRSGCPIGTRTPVKVTLEKCSKDCIISNPMLTNKIKK